MLRVFIALLFTAVAVGPAFADEPKGDPTKSGIEKPAEPVRPASMATVTLKALMVKDGKVASTQAVPVQEVVAVPVTTLVNGRPVTAVEQRTVTRMVVQEVMTPLKDLKATGVDGKEVAGEELEKRLKDGGTVVMYSGTLDPALRTVFKDGTLFIDQNPAVKAAAAPAPPKADK